MRFLRRFIRRMFVCALLIALVWAAGLVWFLCQIPREAARDTTSTDAIVVLTGGAGRIEYGLKLLAEGRAKRLFISGMESKLTPDQLVERIPAQQRDRIEERPDSVIMLGFDARNTIGNAMETGRWMREQRFSSIRLVTANYHIPRAVNEFSFALPQATIISDPVLTDDYQLSDLLRGEGSARIILSEYHKLLAAELRHLLLSATGDA